MLCSATNSKPHLLSVFACVWSPLRVERDPLDFGEDGEIFRIQLVTQS